MSSPPPEATLPVKLHCLGGGLAPPDIVRDLRKVTDLPPRVKQAFWEVLGPSLRETLTPDVEEHLSRFCRAHGADEDALAAVLKACRFLLREASSLDLGRTVFAEDLANLSGNNSELAEILLPGYDAAKSLLRSEILQGSLADHGKLLEGFNWRVDYLTTSDRGDKLRIPVVLLTLRYREGERKKRITLQLLPDALKELRRICDRILT